MSMTARSRAQRKYNDVNTRQIGIKLNLKTDADILEALDKAESKMGFIKQAIREKIKKEAETMTQLVYLKEEAHLEGGTYRLHTEDGKDAVEVLNEYYSAAATTKDGHDLLVVWEIKNREAFEDGDEESACDWKVPTEIYDYDLHRPIDAIVKAYDPKIMLYTVFYVAGAVDGDEDRDGETMLITDDDAEALNFAIESGVSPSIVWETIDGKKGYIEY